MGSAQMVQQPRTKTGKAAGKAMKQQTGGQTCRQAA